MAPSDWRTAACRRLASAVAKRKIPRKITHPPLDASEGGTAPVKAPKMSAEKEADNRSCHGNQKFSARTGRFTPHVGDAPEDKERNLVNGDAVPERHIGVAELMEQDRDKQQHSGNSPHAPIPFCG